MSSGKLTIEEVDRRLRETNIRRVGDYINSKTKMEFMCLYCNSEFVTNPDSVFVGDTTSCGCQKSKIISQKSSIDISGQKIGYSTIISRGKKPIHCGYVWKCLCECGKTFERNRSKICRDKKTLNCGCKTSSLQSAAYLKLDIIGKKFGKLTVLKHSHVAKNINGHRSSYFSCLCECGDIKNIRRSSLIGGRTKTCGNCGVFRNGIPTSFIALRLNELIPEGEHNYNTDVCYKTKRPLNIDIALVDEKIAIEYDGIWWHEHRLVFDLLRSSILIKNGWKVLRIYSSNKLPTKQELLDNIDILKNTNTKFIYMDLTKDD